MNGRRLILGFLLSLVLVYLVVWKLQLGMMVRGEVTFFQGLFGQARIDFGRLWMTLRAVSLLPLVLCFLLTPLHVLVRAHRWAVMVGPVGRLRLMDSYSLQMVGYMANAVLPLRIGEVVRGVLLGRRAKIARSTALATVILERVLDVITLLLLIAVVGFLFPFPEVVRQGAIGFGIGAVLAVGAVLVMAFAPKAFKTVTDPVFGLMPRGIGARVRGTTVRFAAGFSILRSSRDYFMVGVTTVVLWLLYALQGYLVLIAFDFHRVYPSVAASPFLASFVVLVINAVGISLPSAPAGMGTFHAVSIFGLSLFGVPPGPAAGFALVVHAVSVLFYIVAGVPFMWREGLHLGELGRLDAQRG